MNNQENHSELEDVLQAYLEETSKPSPHTLKEWIRRYPQFERELAEFTVAWSVADTLSTSEASRTEDEILELRGRSVLQNVLYKLGYPKAASANAKPTMKGIIHEAAFLGLSPETLAKRLKLSVPLMAKLDRRLVEPSSIPIQAIEAIAEVLRQVPAVIMDYLLNPPTLAVNASYKSRQKPAVVHQENFFDAVREDPELGMADRDYWLSFESK